MANRGSEHWVADHLRRQIVNGEISDGTRVTETEVAAEFGVSRTPARGALRILESEGLIRKRDGRGFKILPVHSGSLEDVFRLRAVLEGLAVRTLAERGMSAKTTERLSASLSATNTVANAARLTTDLLETFQMANAIFHETILRDCGNEALIFAHERLRNLPLYGLNTFVLTAESVDPSLLHLAISHGQHAIMFRAMQEGDGGRAEATMREHSHANLDYAALFPEQPRRSS